MRKSKIGCSSRGGVGDEKRRIDEKIV